MAKKGVLEENSFKWGSEDFVGEQDPKKRNQITGNLLNDVTGVRDVIETVNSLDVNAAEAEIIAAIAFGLAKAKAPEPVDRLLDAIEDKVKKYDVGSFDVLKDRSVKGDKLDIHHVTQKHRQVR